MVDRRPAVAAGATAAQFRVEPLRHLGGDLAHRHVAECRANVVADAPLVAAPGGRLDLMDTQPRVQRRTEGGPGPGVALLVHLGLQPGEDLSSLSLVGS